MIRSYKAGVGGPVESGPDGYYEFNNVPPLLSYDVVACLDIDEDAHVGRRNAIIPPDPFVDIFMLPDPAGCPFLPGGE